MAGILGNIGRGLLTAVGGGPLLAIPNIREAERMKMEAKREQLSAGKRQREAIEGLKGMLGAQSVAQGPSTQMSLESVSGPATPITVPGLKAQVPMLSTGEGRGKALGLLADAAPQEFAGILGRQLFPGEGRAEPSLVREIRALEDPSLSDEQRQILRDRISADPNATDDLNQRVQMQLNALKLQQAIDNQEKAEETAERQRMTAKTSLRRGLEHVAEAANLNRKLAPTFLASGGIGPEARRAFQSGVTEVQDFFGVDTSKARQLLTDFDRFNKLTSDLIIENLGRAAGSGLGTATNQKMQLLTEAMAGLGSQPGANDLIFADMLTELADTARIEGFDIEADKYRTLAEKLRTDRGSVRQYRSLREAEAALASGELKVGDEVTVNGETFEVQE